MSEKDLFQAFTKEEGERYTQEAMQAYDPATVKASAKKWSEYTLADKQRIGAEGNAVCADLVAAIPQGPASAAAQSAVARWRRYIEYFWIPDDAQFLGLADLYNEDPRFRANFDKTNPELAGFMREAFKVHIERLKSGK